MRKKSFLSILCILLILVLISAGPASGARRRGNKFHFRMMGRSVMSGLFNYWGNDTTTPYVRGRYTFTYKALDGPPDIVDSVKRNLPTSNKKNVIFFKLCFVDFEGGSQGAAEANYERNKNYLRQVWNEVCKKRHMKLVIGTALPKVAGETDSYLIWNHTHYNDFIMRFKRLHPGSVRVFDMHKILTDSSTGAIKEGYQTAADDAHPNESGYRALDYYFCSFLRKKFK